MRIFISITSLLLTFSIGASISALTPNYVATVGPVRTAKVAVPQCLRENLSLKEGETDAAMGGVRVTEYLFTNKSSSSCTLKGYPRAELLNRKGVVIRRATHSDETQLGSAKLVTLEPGKDASFNVYYNSGGAGHIGKPCPAYSKIRITAPGTTRPFVLRTDITSCGRKDFQVSSVFEPTPE